MVFRRKGLFLKTTPFAQRCAMIRLENDDRVGVLWERGSCQSLQSDNRFLPKHSESCGIPVEIVVESGNWTKQLRCDRCRSDEDRVPSK